MLVVVVVVVVVRLVLRFCDVMLGLEKSHERSLKPKRLFIYLFIYFLMNV